MDDLDTPTLLMIAVIVLIVLKPDLLSSLFGSNSSGAGSSSSGVGPYALLQPPPAGGIGDPTSARAWKAAGMGDGSGRDAKNPAMPIGWKPGDPVWRDQTGALGDAATSAFNAAHPCPAGEQFNTMSGICQRVVILGGPGGAPTYSDGSAVGDWHGVPPPSQTPPPPARSTGAPEAVTAVKAAARRSAMFTPFTGA